MMSRVASVTVCYLLLFLAVALGQDSSRNLSVIERQIKKLDLAAAEAILKKDERAIDRLFAKDAVTNNPRGGITQGADGVKKLFRSGVIDYLSFTRNIESIQIRGNTVVVMGNETVVPKNSESGNASPYHRRYTNVWMKIGSRWQIIARHASVVPTS